MASHAMARESIASLRRKIARIEGRLAERLDVSDETGNLNAAILLRRSGAPVQGMVPLGVEEFDVALGGGIPRAGLTEIHAVALRDSGVAIGFALGLATLLAASRLVLWIATAMQVREAGRLYAPGLLHRFGFDPANCLFIEPSKPLDALWIAEEAINARIFTGILLEIDGDPRALDLLATQRLHRRAMLAGNPVFLLRAGGQAQPTAAPLRLLVKPAAAGLRRTLSGPLKGSIGPPAFHIAISKSPLAVAASIDLEWSHGTFHKRQLTAAKQALSRAMVSAIAGGEGDAPAVRQIVAFPQLPESGPDLQPPRQQHATRRRA